MGKNLYEFINMSDTITFYAKNDDYARALTLLLGEGKAGCKKEDGTSLEYCMTAFHGSAPQEVYDLISEMVRSCDEELIKALIQLPFAILVREKFLTITQKTVKTKKNGKNGITNTEHH